ncbi:MAG: FG-GAP-like repeat-containing protein [Candidatus Sulfotelmatobacter sp.]
MTRKVFAKIEVLHFGVRFIVILGVVAVLILIFSPAATAQAPSASDVSLFQPVVPYSSGGFEPYSIAVADVNRDGEADILVLNTCANNSRGNCAAHGSVGVLLGNADGTFQPAMEFDSGGAFAISLAIADVNGDDKPDLLVTNFYYTLDVLLGNGDGTFQPALVYDAGGQFPRFIAAADVNGDNKTDLAVAQLFGSIAILLGNGDGTFGAPVIYDWSGSYAGAVATADVNRDGRPDLLVAYGTSGAVAVLLGNGDGTFQPPTSYPTGGQDPDSVVTADVNNDGKLDLVVANSWSSTVGVLLGNGDGTFQVPATYRSGGINGAAKMGLAVADVNGDGKPDLLVSNQCSDSNCLGEAVVGVLLGNGNGIYQSALTFPSGGYLADWVAVSDLNGDGFPDIVVANKCSTNFNCEGTGESMGSVGVLLNNSGTRKVTTTTNIVSSRNPSLTNHTVTFTATVGSSSGAPPDGETITFNNGAAVLGAIPLSAGRASLTTSALPAGIFTITARYPGDSSFAASTSTGIIQTVNSASKSITATTLISSLNPSVYGQDVMFMAQVTTSGPTPPTGAVIFMWKYFTTTYTIGTAILNSSGVATLWKSNLNADPYPMIAVYKGDVNSLGSTSGVLNQVVTQTTSSATITSSLNPSSLGKAVIFTAKIASPTVIPSGPVTFNAGTTVLRTAQLSSGKATFTTSALPAGSTVVKVIYNGNSNVKGSSAAVTQAVQP